VAIAKHYHTMRLLISRSFLRALTFWWSCLHPTWSYSDSSSSSRQLFWRSSVFSGAIHFFETFASGQLLWGAMVSDLFRKMCMGDDSFTFSERFFLVTRSV